MASLILFMVMLLCFNSGKSHFEAREDGFVSVVIAQKGLNFVKDELVKQTISSLVELQLPRIEKHVKIPLVLDAKISLLNITIDGVDVASSYVRTGEMGILIGASGVTANLSMDWSYSYRPWFLPIELSHEGCASILVEDMAMELMVRLENEKGTLSLSLVECASYIKHISIREEGGTAWFHQELLNIFKGILKFAVENAVNKKIEYGILKLDSLLRALPKEISLGRFAALNATFVNEVSLSNGSVGFEINGLFTTADKGLISSYRHQNSRPSLTCIGLEKMLRVSLDEAVFNSASASYFNAGIMHWVVDRVPIQAILNTGSWKYLVPRLYKKYPNDDMDLNIYSSCPPVIRISTPQNLDVTTYSDVIIDVKDGNETIPVVCFSLVISASFAVKIRRNNLVSKVKLNDFMLLLKWSKIGYLHVHLIQSVMRTLLKAVAIPYANLRLERGFPLPTLHGISLRNASIFCENSTVVICSDIIIKEPT